MNSSLIKTVAVDIYTRLSNINHTGEISPKTAARFPGRQCPLFGVMAVAPYIREAKTLVIGPAVCTYNVKIALGLRSATSIPIQDNFLLLPLDQDDVVFGFSTKVQKTIAKIDESCSPELLIVVSTCVPEIIGEDLDAIVEEMKNIVQCRLVVIHADQLNGDDLLVGMERTITSLSEIMQPALFKENTVSLLGYNYKEVDDKELTKLLKTRGISIKRVIPGRVSLQEIITAPAARINLVIDQKALALAKIMEKKFKTPYLYCPRPYTIDGIRIWYQRISKVLGVDLSLEIADLANKAESEIEKLRRKLKGKTFALRSVPARPLEVVKFLVELGMIPVLLHVIRLIEPDMNDARYIIDSGFDPIIVSGDDSVEVDRLLSVLRPDFLIAINCRDIQPASQKGIRVLSIETAAARLGFEGSVETARLLATPDTGFDLLSYKGRYL